MDGLSDVSAANQFRIPRSPGGAKGSGLNLVFAPCERMMRASVRTQTLEVPAQLVATRDGVAVKVDAAICFRVIDAQQALLGKPGFLNSISNLAQTVLRCAMGETTLDELLSKRVNLHVRLHAIADRHVAAWGMKVTLVEVNRVEIDVDPASVWIGCDVDLRTRHWLHPTDTTRQVSGPVHVHGARPLQRSAGAACNKTCFRTVENQR
jgi:hypothetical protein